MYLGRVEGRWRREVLLYVINLLLPGSLGASSIRQPLGAWASRGTCRLVLLSRCGAGRERESERPTSHQQHLRLVTLVQVDFQ